ncbi:hypothetical protein LguiA_021803 [Lonicera macranthoides]
MQFDESELSEFGTMCGPNWAGSINYFDQPLERERGVNLRGLRGIIQGLLSHNKSMPSSSSPSSSTSSSPPSSTISRVYSYKLGIFASTRFRLDSSAILRGIDHLKYPQGISPLLAAILSFLHDMEPTMNSSEGQFFSIFIRGTYQSNAANACGLVELRLGVYSYKLGIFASTRFRLDSSAILRGIDPLKSISLPKRDPSTRIIEYAANIAGSLSRTRRCRVQYKRLETQYPRSNGDKALTGLRRRIGSETKYETLQSPLLHKFRR